jgi:hypothetical protein
VYTALNCLLVASLSALGDVRVSRHALCAAVLRDATSCREAAPLTH